MEKVTKTKQQWLDELDSNTYRITREKGTEPAFSGALYDCKKEGVYLCACCAQPLFSSTSKYDSGSGWPSFFEPLTESAVIGHKDGSHGMQRTEIVCSVCEAHMGHVFPDGPTETGQRYCINSLSIALTESADRER